MRGLPDRMKNWIRFLPPQIVWLNPDTDSLIQFYIRGCLYPSKIDDIESFVHNLIMKAVHIVLRQVEHSCTHNSRRIPRYNFRLAAHSGHVLPKYFESLKFEFRNKFFCSLRISCNFHPRHSPFRLNCFAIYRIIHEFIISLLEIITCVFQHIAIQGNIRFEPSFLIELQHAVKFRYT